MIDSTPRSRFRRRGRWIVLGVVFLVAAVFGLGYVSNRMTASACERQTANWLETLMEDNDWQGPHYTRSAESAWPWIVTVEYFYAVGNLGSEAGHWQYFCLFSRPIALGREVERES